MNFKRPRGTNDILPEDQRYWSHVYATARKIASQFGYSRIDTPTFEDTNLFQRGVGDATDIVQKEMYSFEDHGGELITLRPEGTASVCRAYIENGLHNEPQPVRMYYMAPMFRYERPQSGRVRQHHQFGVEAIGDQSPEVDAEIIELGWKYIAELGIRNVTLRLNSLGDLEGRNGYINDLNKYFTEHVTELPKLDQDRLKRAPLRVLDSKVRETQALANAAPKSVDYIGGETREHWDALLALLDNLKNVYTDFTYSIDHRLVRGLDYYNRTVFEYEPLDAGGQSTLLAGGRYDPLIGILGGQETPGIGFGSGIERMILEMKRQEVEVAQSSGPDIVVVALGDTGVAAAGLATALRAADISTVLAPKRSMKAQMRYANNQNAANVVILGNREVESGVASVKNLAEGGGQSEVALDATSIAQHVRSAGNQ
ncbi:MAG: histidine--tRNA ligase [Dehalococcoidia bacterium]|jgi:histidyl-tRNA synthetase|nr:histidine--tRNA ligase [Chloroflexota bacterium]MDP6056854.1 histidine--tRNA ligase [Dehalococcoidia bacterium]MDP7090540.1 histidine--tRNA ligase [Dehalococcoidia bacterium]MDP7261007.1 histidine--tRNA ligase [Dehalococcoidia bacterium]MDP7486349.1 histidine--tRNA ligase [Dehalococcoidia bacterium]|tara:strand:- start:2927 stop:4210 length:1284 start_codon:yes stop_codon:yes gene_type:complete